MVDGGQQQHRVSVLSDLVLLGVGEGVFVGEEVWGGS